MNLSHETLTKSLNGPPNADKVSWFQEDTKIATAGTVQIEELVRKVQAYNPQADIGLLERSYTFTARVHRGQERVSGEPYL